MSKKINKLFIALFFVYSSCSNKQEPLQEKIELVKIESNIILDNGVGFDNFLTEEIQRADFYYNRLGTNFYLEKVQTIDLSSIYEYEVKEKSLVIAKNTYKFKEGLELFFVSCEIFSNKKNGYDCIDKNDLSFPLEHNCESFFLMGTDSLFLEDIFNPIGKAYTQHNFRIGEILSFSFQKESYLVINVLESCINEANNLVRAFLVRIKSNGEFQFILTPYFQGTQTICPFNDFNADGNLDYAGWNWDKARIEFFSLKDDKFIIDSQYHIQLRESDYSEGYQGFIIDYEKTSWVNSLDSLKEILY